MATLAQLLPYLQQGYSIKCSAPGGETFTPSRLGRIIGTTPETLTRAGLRQSYTLGELAQMQGGLWDYAVVFADWQGREMLLSNINQIEQAILDGWAHPTWGELPQSKTNHG